MIQYRLNENTLTVFLDYIPEIISDSHPNFDKIIKVIKNNGTEEEVKELLQLEHEMKQYISDDFSQGKVTIEHGELKLNGVLINSTLSNKIIQMKNEGFTIEPMVKFLEKLYENPSKRAVDSLYDFLEAGNIPITENGNILTYKKIKSNWTDCHTGTIDNSIGQVVSMPRNTVNEDPDETCSQGLHVCSFDYLQHFSGDRVVACEVNPKDVVAIPRDYNQTKMRVCEYKIIKELKNIKPFSSSIEIIDKTKGQEVKQKMSIHNRYKKESFSLKDIENLVLPHSWVEIKEKFEEYKELENFFNGTSNSTYLWKNKLIKELFTLIGKKEETKEEKSLKFLKTKLKSFDDIELIVNKITDLNLIPDTIRFLDGVEEFINKNKTKKLEEWQTDLINILSDKLGIKKLEIIEPKLNNPSETANWVAINTYHQLKDELYRSYVLNDCYLFLEQIDPNSGDWKTPLIKMINSILFFKPENDEFEIELEKIKKGNNSVEFQLKRFIENDELAFIKLLNFFPQLRTEIILAEHNNEVDKLAKEIDKLIKDGIIKREDIINEVGF